MRKYAMTPLSASILPLADLSLPHVLASSLVAAVLGLAAAVLGIAAAASRPQPQPVPVRVPRRSAPSRHEGGGRGEEAPFGRRMP